MTVDGSTIQVDSGRVEKLWAQKEEITRLVQAYLDPLDDAAPTDGPDHKPPQ